MIGRQKTIAETVAKIDPDLEELIPGYLKNRHRDIDTIIKYLVQGNYRNIQVIGHSMKGSGGGYGFAEISEIGGHLEQSACKKDEETIRHLVKDLKSYLNKVQVILEQV